MQISIAVNAAVALATGGHRSAGGCGRGPKTTTPSNKEILSNLNMYVEWIGVWLCKNAKLEQFSIIYN
jgi:hypothetical protein